MGSKNFENCLKERAKANSRAIKLDHEGIVTQIWLMPTPILSKGGRARNQFNPETPGNVWRRPHWNKWISGFLSFLAQIWLWSPLPDYRWKKWLCQQTTKLLVMKQPSIRGKKNFFGYLFFNWAFHKSVIMSPAQYFMSISDLPFFLASIFRLSEIEYS